MATVYQARVEAASKPTRRKLSQSGAHVDLFERVHDSRSTKLNSTIVIQLR